MAPSDNSSYKIPTRPAKKTAQTKSSEEDASNPLAFRRHSAFVINRARRAAVYVEQVIDAVYPLSTPGERDSHALFKEFCLNPRGLALTETQYRAMDWLERLERSREWLKKHAERVRKAQTALAHGRPIDPKTREICRLFLDWCRDHKVDPKKPVKNECLREISPKVHLEDWKQSPVKAQEKVRSRIEAARDSLWWEFLTYEVFVQAKGVSIP